jgi:hypothetical protein
VKKIIIPMLLMVLIVPSLLQARPLKMNFKTSDSANLIWMIDQLSQWDKDSTRPEYRTYWDRKLGLTQQDKEMLLTYSAIRKRLAVEKESEKSIDSALIFREIKVSKADQYLLAFLEIPGLQDAIGVLPASQEDKDKLFNVFKHFGKKFGTAGGWGKEISHLASFRQQAEVLANLTDTSGFLTTVREFIGVTDMPAEITVDSLWAPPGLTPIQPRMIGFHILLPLPVSAVTNDQEVVAQIANAVQMAVRYILGRLPLETRLAGDRYVLARAGLINPGQPSLIPEAIAAAIGQVHYFQERFPDLNLPLLVSPLRGDQPYPDAGDLLARRFAPELKNYLGKKGTGLIPEFLVKVLDVQNKILPPTPKALARTAIFIANNEDLGLLKQAFQGPTQYFFPISEADNAAKTYKGTNRPCFIVIRTGAINSIRPLLAKMGITGRRSPNLKKYRKSSVIYPLSTGASGPVVILLVQNQGALVNTIKTLYRMDSLPSKAQSVR